ncbi:MAG: winged helix-turn-helix domain-containing protein [Bacteroidales bacterium]
MNRKLILNAFLIWKELNSVESLTLSKLRSLTKLTEMEIEASLQWLLHEQKILISSDENEKRISKKDNVLIYI